MALSATIMRVQCFHDSYTHYRLIVGCGRREALMRAIRYERGIGTNGLK